MQRERPDDVAQRLERPVFEGTVVRLRSLDPERDISVVRTLESDETALRLHRAGEVYLHSTRELEAWMDELRTIPGVQYHFVIELAGFGRAVGTCSLTALQPTDRHAEVSIAVYEHERGHGFGGDALSVLVDFGFEQLLLNKIKGRLAAANPAVRLLERHGFAIDARYREHAVIDGQRGDLLEMSVLRADRRAA